MSVSETKNAESSLFSRLAQLPDIAIAAILALLTIALLLVLEPLADIPMNDDFSWARSAEAFAHTGKIIYNGWGNPILLPHIIIGGLLVKLFGFSHIVLQIFGIISGGTLSASTYLLARACRVRRTLSLLTVALTVLNPVFLGIAPSFMSDIPSAVLYMGALLAFLRSTKKIDGTNKSSLQWFPLSLATILAFLAGANRQILWAALFIAFTSVFFQLAPSDRLRKLIPVLLFLIVSALGLSLWFSAQPYSVTVSLEGAQQFLQSAPELLVWYPYKFLAMVGLATLPVTVPVSMIRWKAQTKPFLRFIACLAFGVVPYLFFLTRPLPGREYWNGVWRVTQYGQYATFQGVMVGGPSGYADRPWMMPQFVGSLLNVLGAFGIGLLLWCLLTRPKNSLPINVLLGASLSQLLLPLPWYATGSVFDRYLVTLVPTLLIAILVPSESDTPMPPQKTEQTLRPFLIGLPLVVLFAYGGIAFATEYFDYTQTRAKLYHLLLKKNIAPQNIDAGVETSGDTQIALGTYINNANIKNPSDAFHPDQGGNCNFAPGYFPVMDSQYLLSTQYPAPDITGIVTRDPLTIVPEPIAKETYYSPIAPNIRTMYVYRVTKLQLP